MIVPTKETIPDLLIANISRETLMGIDEALAVGARRAYTAAHGMDEGHLPHVVGQLRHFHMNEAFQRALSASGTSPSPIRGNAIITGNSGVFRLARFNISAGIWNNGRRSKTRRQLSIANTAIEPLVQPDLFKDYVPPTEAVVFFVACFSSSLRLQPETPVSIQVAVPDRHMQSWLFRESIGAFVQRYDEKPIMQRDLASPKLKKVIDKQQKKDGTKR